MFFYITCHDCGFKSSGKADSEEEAFKRFSRCSWCKSTAIAIRRE